MITTEEYCALIVGKFLVEEKELTNDLSLFKEEYVFGSSSLAVAANRLGLLTTPHIKEYAESRGGVITMGVLPGTKEVRSLSVADMIKLLDNYHKTNSN